MCLSLAVAAATACTGSDTIPWDLETSAIDLGTVSYLDTVPEELVEFRNQSTERSLYFSENGLSGDGSELLVVEPPENYAEIGRESNGEIRFTLDADTSGWTEGSYTVSYGFQLSMDFDDEDDAERWVEEDATIEVSFAIDCDLDEDGYLAEACGGEDCDDQDASISPIDVEYCDGVDNDCDGTTDEAGASNVTPFYADLDEDGYGDAGTSTDACEAPSGYVEDNTDCDDDDADVNPAATEVCDEVDNDCDETIDESGASDATTWYADVDGDGYGDAEAGEASCSQPSGSVADGTDCDDGDTGIHPGADETCDDVDEDCDDSIDEDAMDPTTFYADDDGDGYGDADDSTESCESVSGYVDDGTDCDDADADINPGEAELEDLVDQDCDGLADEDYISEGDLILSEIMADPDYVGDSNGEWFEVHNTSSEDRDIIGWTVTSDGEAGFTIEDSVVVVAGKFAVLGVNSKSSSNGKVTVDYEYDRSDCNLNNTSDTLALYMGTTLMHEVSYDSDWELLTGASLSLDPDAVGGDDTSASSWCASSSYITTNGDLGTPNDANDDCPVEDTGDTGS